MLLANTNSFPYIQSPKHVPTDRADCNSGSSGGTVLWPLATSSNGTSTRALQWIPTIHPYLLLSRKSMALVPKRVASTLSNGVGTPPLWRWPNTTVRVSIPVSLQFRSQEQNPRRRNGPGRCSPLQFSGQRYSRFWLWPLLKRR